MKDGKGARRGSLPKQLMLLVRSWFELTPDENRAVLLVLVVALLGLAVRLALQ